MEVQGIDKLFKKLDSLSNMCDSEVMNQAMLKAGQVVRNQAKMLCPVNMGELRNSILLKISNQEKVITSAIYTNKKYARYVEFGTGPVGQAKHNGITPNITPTYTQHRWFIPESYLDPAVIQKYHFRKIVIKNKTFYVCYGQRAQPFMYPSIKNTQKQVVNIIKAEIKKVR